MFIFIEWRFNFRLTKIDNQFKYVTDYDSEHEFVPSDREDESEEVSENKNI